jgi:arsenite methyltransferase
MGRALLWTGLALFALSFSWGCTSFKRWAYEGSGRDSWQHPNDVIRALQIRPGEQIADIGAGGGYFTFRLADAVGKDGKVYAVDIDEGMVSYLKERAATDHYENVEVILATPEDPKLPAGGVDLIFTSDTYHHFDDPTAYFTHIKRYLHPGGRVAIIDLKDEGFFAWLFGHATDVDVMRQQMRAAGYEVQAEYAFLPRQEFLVFTPQAG